MNSSSIVDELKSIIPQAFQQELQDLVQQNHLQSDGYLLLSLCNMFRNKVEIKSREYLAFGKYKVKVYSHKMKQDTSITDQDLMVYGAQLIYTIRKFLNDGQELIYHFASKGPDGKFLSDAYISQSTVLKKMSQVSAKGIGVTLALQKQLIEENINTDTRFTNMWKRVEYLAEPSKKGSFSKRDKIYVKNTKEGKALWAYQNQKKDTQVYICFHGKNIVKYYKMGNALIQFNNGWLWQWYDNIYNSGDEEKNRQVNDALRAGSLEPIFQDKDYIPGTKQGDYRNAQEQWIQNKYANTKIITYNNILKIMQEFTTALELFLTANSNAEIQNNLLDIMKTNFIPDTAYAMSKEAEKIIDQKLLAKLTQTKNFSII